MKEISLTKGYKALVDDEDFNRVNQHKWQADVSRDGLRVYAITTITKPIQQNIRLHRLILNAKAGDLVDHRNGNASTLDCRKQNLRLATKSLNAINSKINKRNRSGYRGVSFHPQTGKWRASITIDGKRKSLGLYATPEQASDVVEVARTEQWG